MLYETFRRGFTLAGKLFLRSGSRFLFLRRWWIIRRLLLLLLLFSFLLYLLFFNCFAFFLSLFRCCLCSWKRDILNLHPKEVRSIWWQSKRKGLRNMGVDQNKRFSLFSNKDMIIRHNTKKRHLQIQAYDMNAPPSPSLAPQSHSCPATSSFYWCIC